MKSRNIILAILLLLGTACTTVQSKHPLIGKDIKEISGRLMSVYLGLDEWHIPLDHFIIEYKRLIEYESKTITITGTLSANPYRNKIPHADLIKLRKINIEVLFLNSVRKVIAVEKFDLNYPEGQGPDVFNKIPFNVTFPYSPEYVHMTFLYRALIEQYDLPKTWENIS